MGVGRLDLTDGEMKLLACAAMHVQRIRPSKYMEIGVFGGGTIKFIMENAPGIQCTGVDLFEDFVFNEENTHCLTNPKIDEVKKYLENKARLIKGESSKILDEMIANKERFDLIFIDGNHKYEATKKDYEKSLVLLNEGGFMAFHNCSPQMEPDWNLYNKIDGGPWSLVTKIKMNRDMIHIDNIDRLSLFGKVNKI
jgi:predicted O-methyltransferase YrrM